MSSLATLMLASGAAFFYMAASWIMKEWGSSSLVFLIPAVLATLAVGAWFEIEVLKFSRLGHIIILILAVELVMTFFVATAVLGESYSRREIIAVMVIASGIGILSWTPSTASDTVPARIDVPGATRAVDRG